ncbi:MAG: hypothetical protein A2451_16740, partial [Bdellovibrionales bacterium RIFOXYC2_FULL_39_8]
LKIGNELAIERTVKMMRRIFSQLILITNTPNEYAFLSLPMYSDLFKQQGPLAGIHAALKNVESEKVFIISCDMPLITEETIRFILDYPSFLPIVVPKADGFVQQLCGIYSRSVVELAEGLLSSSDEEEGRDKHQHKRKCKVMSLLEMAGATKIEMEQEFGDYKANSFLNMNRLDEYEAILKLI